MDPVKAPDNKKADIPKKGINPFIKLIQDHERIAETIKNKQPLSSLTDIKFVQPI